MDAAKWMDKPGMRRFGRQPSDDQMKNAKRLEEAKAAQATLKTLPSVLAFLPNMVLVPVMRTYIMYKEAQINSPTARRAQVELLGILAGVFVCWRLKAFQPLMTKWFLHNPVAWTKRQDWRNSFTMLTSTVSRR
jgi:rhomboid-like protein